MSKLKKESPDTIYVDDKFITNFESDDAIAFGYHNDELYMGDESSDYHYDLNPPLERSDYEYAGRMWTDKQIISFWDYPENNSKLKSICIDLENMYSDKFGEDIDIWNDFQIEIFDGDDPEELDDFGTLIPTSQYKSSGNANPDIQHQISPMKKQKVEVPRGWGSTKRPAGLSHSQYHQTKSTSEGRIKLKDLVLEDTIAQLIKRIDIKIDIDKTQHASDRQSRDNRYITNDEIKNVVDKAMPLIAEALLFDEIDIDRDYIAITDRNTKLNVVGIMRSGNNNKKMYFIVVTVIIKDNFKVKPGTISIKV